MDSDEQLMNALANGSEEALRELYRRHAVTMLRMLQRLAPDRSVAEEIMQEAWLAVWQAASSFRGDSSVRGWLLGVARRQAHNRLRRPSPPTTELSEAQAVADPTVDIEAQALVKADLMALAEAVAALPDHLREVVILAVVDELPYRDVAAVLGIALGTVKSRMAHARVRLAAAVGSGRA
ncbi:RNA polymerase sigma factor [Micromonospora sp. DT233]|uniref:RNA polymerase sigma factor n=1 Tax=Micromonospora sp. DT233 TaxID=3393432 RepID=UPI003CF06E5F